MITKETIELLGLGISPIDEKTVLMVGGGLEWVKDNTTFEFDMNNDEDLKTLPYSVRLFLVKFCEINKQRLGVSSESISGLSQSFDNSEMDKKVWQAAVELFSNRLKSRISFIPAQRRWV